MTGLSISTIRRSLIKSGTKLRGKSESIRLSGKTDQEKGKKKIFTEQHLANLRKSMIERSKKANGISLKKTGYLVLTKGKDVNKMAHVDVMEKRLGFTFKGMVVHHIDLDKTNNDIDNLALMTNSAHARLHRMMDKRKLK